MPLECNALHEKPLRIKDKLAIELLSNCHRLYIQDKNQFLSGKVNYNGNRPFTADVKTRRVQSGFKRA